MAAICACVLGGLTGLDPYTEMASIARVVSEVATLAFQLGRAAEEEGRGCGRARSDAGGGNIRGLCNDPVKEGSLTLALALAAGSTDSDRTSARRAV